MNNVIFICIAVYLQIQIAQLKTGISSLHYFASKRLLFRDRPWCITGKVPSICFVRITKHFFQQYIDFVSYLKLSKEWEKWKTRFDATYFFSHQPYQRINLQQWGLGSMCQCLSVHLSKAKEPDSVLIKKKKKKGMIRYDTRGKHTMQNTSESLLLTKCLTVESDRRFSSFTFSDPLAWDGWGELVTTVRDPWLILTTLWL